MSSDIWNFWHNIKSDVIFSERRYYMFRLLWLDTYASNALLLGPFARKCASLYPLRSYGYLSVCTQQLDSCRMDLHEISYLGLVNTLQFRSKLDSSNRKYTWVATWCFYTLLLRNLQNICRSRKSYEQNFYVKLKYFMLNSRFYSSPVR
jgi:hypothetical protein